MFLNIGDLISGDAGHNCSPDIGANGYRLEDTLTKEVWLLVKEKLNSKGYLTKDCTPWNVKFDNVNESLSFRVNEANKSGSKFHLCIHFNAGGGTGVECYINGTNNLEKEIAASICNSISKLGYTNRGVKTANLYVPRYTTMPCVLIECSFVDSQQDMDKYSADAIAEAIVFSITNSPVDKPSDFSYSNNAIVEGDFLYIRDSSGTIIPGRQVEIGDNITVISINHETQLAFVEYPTSAGMKTGYVSNVINCIKYYFQNQYLNGSTFENVYDENNNKIGSLDPFEKATPLYRKNGKLHVVYNTSKGSNSKSGYVNYSGNFNKF